ncbi:IclR family transcriptional regulator [Azospirillum picis]|uniref:DNA-binding IclR family transcriptional regulator n=1 Tax=Azospirillum picis TaxID=488438 RepID=A0ABU0MMM9_9PROT|nr:IclR family transcriptional regulator [Azospirillum picis]MBP2300499.1 DNA-binding IclR family transcriptional regulator [Azospirillum picis]MDQ0534468.1 DNA-binding IclR family transcriptional regulator [Azospirillum picis]
MSKTSESRYFVDAVDKAAALLLIIASEPGLGLSEVARRSGESKARVLRLLRTLEMRGLVTCTPQTRVYKLGYAAALIGRAAMEQVDLVQLGQPVVERLGREFNETAQLRIREGDQSLCVAFWEPQRELRVHTTLNRRRPLHAGSGKLLLAFAPPLLRSEILSRPLPALTDNTSTDATVLKAQLEEIRSNGYCVSRGEVTRDLISVSAPILGPDGLADASILISAPATRLPDDILERCIVSVRTAAAELSSMLGRS